MHLKAYWACRDINNFGDVITPYILRKITGMAVVFAEDLSTPHIFLSGSILREATDHSIVIGSGFGAKNQELNGAPTIHAVRGPITKKMVGQDVFVGDPALLLPYLYDSPQKVTHEIGIVPHYVDAPTTEHFTIDITAPVEEVIDGIRSCEVIISSSLHGLVAANAYGIPAIWAVFSDGIAGDGMKYHDYFQSMGTDQEEPLDCREGFQFNKVKDVPQVGTPPEGLYERYVEAIEHASNRATT